MAKPCLVCAGALSLAACETNWKAAIGEIFPWFGPVTSSPFSISFPMDGTFALHTGNSSRKSRAVQPIVKLHISHRSGGRQQTACLTFTHSACLLLWDKSQTVHPLTWQYGSDISPTIVEYSWCFTPVPTGVVHDQTLLLSVYFQQISYAHFKYIVKNTYEHTIQC